MKTILTDGFRTLGEKDIPEDLQVPACWFFDTKFCEVLRSCKWRWKPINQNKQRLQIIPVMFYIQISQMKSDQIQSVEKDAGGRYNLTPQIAATIDSLWQEPLVREAYDNRAEYQLDDSAA